MKFVRSITLFFLIFQLKLSRSILASLIFEFQDWRVRYCTNVSMEYTESWSEFHQCHVRMLELRKWLRLFPSFIPDVTHLGSIAWLIERNTKQFYNSIVLKNVCNCFPDVSSQFLYFFAFTGCLVPIVFFALPQSTLLFIFSPMR